MNEDRLPIWVGLRRRGASGSPRRVAEFPEQTTELQWARFPTINAHSHSHSHDTQTILRASPESSSRKIINTYLEENTLMMYCRCGMWDQALERCETHSHETSPTLLETDFFEEAWGSFSSPSTKHKKVPVYCMTPLGILCNSAELNHIPSDTIVALALALCRAGNKVSASQDTVGNTPLRQALRNPLCPPQVVAALLQQPDALTALTVQDEFGMYPLDYLLQATRKLDSPETQEAFLDAFLQHAPLQELGQNLMYSPLVRLYATGETGHAGLQQSWRHQISVHKCASISKRNVVMMITQKLLKAMPTLLNIPSYTTGCMPIHAALRNFGNDPTLISVLLAHNENNNNDNSKKSSEFHFMLHRNHFGDLPIHVACACGVPLAVLRLVLARTVQAAIPLRRETDSLLLDTIIWTTNHAGYTPIDLEWIRHIEGGNGFISHAVFQPIGVEGIPRPRGRYDDLYHKLLRQAVDQVMSYREKEVIGATNSERTVNNETYNEIFGLLMHRIFLIIRATFHDSFSQSPFDLSGDILHQASALFQPEGPTIPEAVMDLLLWKYPEQVTQRDHLGRTPLHHAVHIVSPTVASSTRSKGAAWERWIQKLMETPARCTSGIPDSRSRYPLHIALDGGQIANIGTTLQLQQQVHEVVKQLVYRSPEILQVPDPVSRFYPAMLAANNPLVPLDTVFWLLRQEPGILPRTNRT